MDKNKRVITILSVFTIIFTLVGGTFAWWTWTSNVNTGVAFTIEKEFSCSADGGQNINSTNIQLQPTSDCTNSDYALQRTIKVTPDIKRDSLTISLDMWLIVNSLGTGLSNSDNFMYAITTNPNSCTTDVIAKGNFKGLTTNDKVNLLNGKEYTGMNLPQDTYYLYIWLDAKENNNDTQNESFNFSLGGECTDAPKPEIPVLDENAMIPVKIANDGTVTTVSKDDPNWYDYSNKEWANVVLVNENATANVEGSQPRSYYLSNLSSNVEVTPEDILAYYVWIPRYKYKMPQTKCSSIPVNERNMEDYPECYAPYTLTEEDKNDLIRFFSDDNIAEGEYEESQIYIWGLENINYALENGRLVDGRSILEYVESYNILLNEEGYFSNTGDEMLGDEINLVDGEFNENITFTTKEGTIDIAFEPAFSSMILGNATSEYRTHSAFWWDDDNDNIVESGEMLAGLWVGKFESSFLNRSEVILPNRFCGTLYDVEGCFNSGKKISDIDNKYGINSSYTNSHMAKNSEWGAVAYLSHSEYGLNGQIRMNNYYREYGENSYMTGCGAADGVSSNVSTCAIPYGSGVSEYPQSTTGNITGVFDMEGGASEYVMGHYGETIIGNDNSGFEELPERKYYDLYKEEEFPGTYNNMVYCTIDSCGGDALYETAWWYNNYSYWFVSSSIYGGPWLYRDGVFSFFPCDGNTMYFDFTWRSVLVPGFGE